MLRFVVLGDDVLVAFGDGRLLDVILRVAFYTSGWLLEACMV